VFLVLLRNCLILWILCIYLVCHGTHLFASIIDMSYTIVIFYWPICLVFRAWIFISKGMMGKLSPVKTSTQLCVMPIMPNFQTSYNGNIYLSVMLQSYKQNLIVQEPWNRYSQAGTPTVKVASSYDANSQTFSLKFRWAFILSSFKVLVHLQNLLLCGNRSSILSCFIHFFVHACGMWTCFVFLLLS
jgi:hypothetical protein